MEAHHKQQTKVMYNDKKNFEWNYYLYAVINLTTGKVYNEFDDKETAKKVCRDKNNELQYKFCVQQIHSVARVI